MDDIPFIPCEFCEEPVPANEYYRHANLCQIRSTLPQFVTVRDDDDNAFYRVDMGNAVQALEMLISRLRVTEGSSNMNWENVPNESNADDNNTSRSDVSDVMGIDTVGADTAFIIQQTFSDDEDSEIQQQNGEVGNIETRSSNVRLPLLNIIGNHAQSLMVVPRMSTFLAIQNLPFLNLGGDIGQLTAENLGKVYVGLDDPDRVLKPVSDSLDTTNEICPICQDNLTEPISTICNHTYCENCIRKWLKDHKKCPVCMIDLEDMLAEMEMELKMKNESECENMIGDENKKSDTNVENISVTDVPSETTTT